MTRRFLLLGCLAALSAVGVTLMVPRGHTLTSWWLLLAYLVPFVLATEAIAHMDPAWFARWRLAELAGVATFAVFFCVFAPKMFARVLANDFAGFYSLMRVLTPLLILGIALAYRLGGGAGSSVRRMAYASILVMLSGVEDLLFWVWRGSPVPGSWDWADHITVILGHVASRTEACVFIGVHLVAAVTVLLVPACVRRGRVRPEPSTPNPAGAL